MDVALNTEYIIQFVLELIDKCETLDELRESLKKILDAHKKGE